MKDSTIHQHCQRVVAFSKRDGHREVIDVVPSRSGRSFDRAMSALARKGEFQYVWIQLKGPRRATA